MYTNILLSTDGSDVAKKGVKQGMTLAKALNAKVTVITVTESPMLYLPREEDLVGWEAARKEVAGKVLDEARAMAEQIGISAELLHVPNAPPATYSITSSARDGRVGTSSSQAP